MELTQTEILHARRVLARLDGSAKWWPLYRWLGVAASIFLVGCGAWSLWRLHGLLGRGDDVADLFFARPATAQTVQLDRDAMRLYVDHQFCVSMAAFTIGVSAVLYIVVGSGLLAATAVRWSRHMTDALLAKLLRRELSRQEANEPDA